ncbi:MAG: hypothetical protein V2A64_03160 [Candidatus Omnitrophota bacterium]
MKKIINLISFFTAVCFIAGCAHLSFKNTSPNSLSGIKNIKIKKIAIFPFADYSYQQDEVTPLLWGLNRRIIEELSDEFMNRGITVAIQEDVDGLLVSEGIIKSVDPKEISRMFNSVKDELRDENKEENSRLSPKYELYNQEHSEEMITEIKKIVAENNKSGKDGKMREQELMLAQFFKIRSLFPHRPLFQGVTASLSKDKIRDLGREMGVDAVLRGRIIEAGTLEKTNPVFSNQGIIPFILGPIDAVLRGRPDHSSSLNYAHLNEYETGLLDAYSCKPYPTGKKMSVVQIRVYLQDVERGEIIWSGRSEVIYNPKVVKEYRRDLFNKAVRKAVSSLTADLFKKEGKSPQRKIIDNTKMRKMR